MGPIGFAAVNLGEIFGQSICAVFVTAGLPNDKTVLDSAGVP